MLDLGLLHRAALGPLATRGLLATAISASATSQDTGVVMRSTMLPRVLHVTPQHARAGSISQAALDHRRALVPIARDRARTQGSTWLAHAMGMAIVTRSHAQRAAAIPPEPQMVTPAPIPPAPVLVRLATLAQSVIRALVPIMSLVILRLERAQLARPLARQASI
jgi:hypothetical protein